MGGHNHYPWCNCGWCVKDRGYRYTDNHISKNTKTSSTLYVWDYPNISRIETYKSFTVPNVQCNCCGLDIFFYQSPYGGKVFFEELGHPWTKHCCEPKCCTSKKNIPKKNSNSNFRLSTKSPLWEKEGWIPYLSVREEEHNTLIKRIILKSMKNNNEYSFFIEKKYFKEKLKEGFLLNFRTLNEKFGEVSFPEDEKAKIEKNKIIVSNDFSSDYLRVCQLINYGLYLIEDENSTNIELAQNFFSVFHLKDYEPIKKYELLNNIINHSKSKESTMNKVYKVILDKGMKEFEIKFNDNLYHYSEEVLKTLYLLPSKVYLRKIKQILANNKIRYRKKNKIINYSKNKKNNHVSKKYQQQTSVFKKKEYKTNLNQNRKKWKGISIYKPKKELIFIEKDDKL